MQSLSDLLMQASPTGGAAPIQQSAPLSPWQAATAGPVSGLPGGNMWDKLMSAVGQAKPPQMPGTTIGAPAGAPGMAPAAPPPMLPPQTQMMPPPRGIPNLSALLNPTAGGAGNQGLMAQYMALQQLMRGA